MRRVLIAAAAAVGLVLVAAYAVQATPTVSMPSQGATVSCVLDSLSGCTIAHGFGVKPVVTAVSARVDAYVSVDPRNTTDTTYRINYRKHTGALYAAVGTALLTYVHFDFDGVAPTPNPTPTPSPTPTPTPTVSPTPTPTPPTGWSCVVEKSEGNTGCPDNLSTPGYVYPKLPNSNGYTTYVEKDCWGHPECQYKLEANNPGDWQVTAVEPAGETGVQTFPDAQQLTNNWCPNDPGFKDCTVASTDMQISQLTKLTSTYAESTPSGVTAQFAWDLWASNNTASSVNEIMVWVDNHNRGSGGAPQVGTATINGQEWTIFRNGTELIWSLGAPGTFAQQTSATVDLLAILNASISKGFLSAGTRIAQVNAGWEICSTGGVDKTFRVTDYSVTAVPA